MRSSILAEDLERIHAGLAGQRAAFAGSTVLLTGCGGFLGFYIAQYLVRNAAELGVERVIALDNFLLERPQWLSALIAEHAATLDVRTFDISRDELGAVQGAADANLVVHAASIASPTFYRRFPLQTIDANVWGLRRILDFYRDRPRLRGLLFFSSSEIYGDPGPDFIPTTEDYRGNVSCHGPRACYDEAKRIGETLCWVYAQEHGMPITVARPFNNYGPGMRVEDRRLPADFAKAVLEGRDLVILSNGAPTRTFCYVSDAVTGYLLCLLHGRYDYFNIGIERPEVSVQELAEVYRSAAGEMFQYRGEVRYQTSDDPAYLTDNPARRCPSIVKARQTLGYDPTVLVQEGVGRYLRFLKETRA